MFQSVVNIKPEKEEETEEQKEEKHKGFVEKHEKQIKHFGEGLNTALSRYTQFCLLHKLSSVLTRCSFKPLVSAEQTLLDSDWLLCSCL